MADYTAHPTTTDLQELLESAGLYNADWNLDLQGALDGAVQWWRDVTEFQPFLSTGSADTRPYNPPSGTVLRLQNGLLSCASVVLTDSAGNETTLVAGEDYWLEPVTAPAEGWPYTRLCFDARPSAKPGGVAVEGVWGFAEEYPAIAWRAVLHAAAVELSGVIGSRIRRDAEAASTSQIVEQEAGPLRVKYNAVAADKLGNLRREKDEWAATAFAAARRYSLV